jgi:hypothetical protein
MEPITTPHILICDCSSREHQIILEHEPDDNLIYCHIHLRPRRFWARVWAALKYVGGYKCRYGHFEEFIFKPDHVPALQQLTALLETQK